MDAITKHKQLLQEAEACLTRIQEGLTAAKELADDEEDGGSEGTKLRTLQLLLQFRLDTQDALQHLFRYSQSMWHILGISPIYSGATNLERLSFALGSEDLHHALSILNQVIDALLRLLQRMERKQRVTLNRQAVTMHPPPTPSRLQQKIVYCEDNLKSFIFIMEDLSNTLETLQMQEEQGTIPMLDYISKLEGPISHFYQALQHGLIAAAGIYQQLEATAHMNLQLDALLFQAKTILEKAPAPLLEKPRLFQPTKPISTSQTLEARAAEKRLGHFF